jgi:hypothetical protein
MRPEMTLYYQSRADDSIGEVLWTEGRWQPQVALAAGPVGTSICAIPAKPVNVYFQLVDKQISEWKSRNGRWRKGMISTLITQYAL